MKGWNSRRSPVLTKRGVCSSNEPTASAIGAKVLEAGGTAADACVAVAASLNVLQPCMSGLGGDSFALYYTAISKKVYCLQGNGVSPADLTLDVINQSGFGVGLRPLDMHSGLCVTVPGAAALWEDLIRNHGVLTLSQVLAPAISLAEEGFPISPITASAWGGYLNEEGKRVLRPKGRVLIAGEVIRNPDLGRTMRCIAEKGAKEGFYGGPVAAAVVEAVRAHGGVLSLQDLTSHQTRCVESISVAYKASGCMRPLRLRRGWRR